MGDQLIAVEALMHYLGTDEENREAVEDLLATSIADLNSMAGRDVTRDRALGQVNAALRAMVYLGYYMRGEKPGNLEFIQQHLSGIITRLQLTPSPQEEIDDAV